ncbi:MAG: protein phosphatase 2C domain-containing protein [Acidobacteria bacterium]|nr:protein phosphatase 2C domain-containing protein [Acidobacteriota bacterium]
MTHKFDPDDLKSPSPAESPHPSTVDSPPSQNFQTGLLPRPASGPPTSPSRPDRFKTATGSNLIDLARETAITGEFKVLPENFDELPTDPLPSLEHIIFGPRWRYLPSPCGPEPRPDSVTFSAHLPTGFEVLGARVRGKKHKHEGSHCDDWFEVASVQNWSILALADGAGSKRFSRIGAKVSCQRAVEVLTRRLASHRLEHSQQWCQAGFSRPIQPGDRSAYLDPEVEYLQTSLHLAAGEALRAVEHKAHALLTDDSFLTPSERSRLSLKDFSSTLLLAIHIPIPDQKNATSLVVACQIGDGMTAVIDSKCSVKLLGIPDEHEPTGKTEFLTTSNRLNPDFLTRRTFVFCGDVKALLMMSDGVADDYYPMETELLTLLGDLKINGILPIQPGNRDEMLTSLSSLHHLSPEQIQSVPAASKYETITPAPETVYLKSFKEFTRMLDLTPAMVLQSPELMWLATQTDHPLLGEDSETSLRKWLDAYQKRGSFDDRTLLVVYPQEPSS